MKVLLVLASIGMLASAAPQYPNSASSSSSGGYSGSANPLAGIDIAQLLQAVSRQTSQSYGAPAPAQAAPAPASQSYGAPAQQQQGYSAPAPAPAAPQQNYGAPAAAPAAPAQAPGSNYGAPGGSANDGGFGGGNNNGGNNGDDQPTQQVHKHVYIHVAPSETPEPKAISAPRAPQIPEKHYKILFIRTPEPAPYTQPDIIDGPPAAEQKTLVYVLLKKPDATPAIQLPTAAPTKPSKPEVYFIRYKSPEAAAADANDNNNNNNNGGNNGGNNAYGPPAAAPAAPASSPAEPSSQYGPARPNGGY